MENNEARITYLYRIDSFVVDSFTKIFSSRQKRIEKNESFNSTFRLHRSAVQLLRHQILRGLSRWEQTAVHPVPRVMPGSLHRVRTQVLHGLQAWLQHGHGGRLHGPGRVQRPRRSEPDETQQRALPERQVLRQHRRVVHLPGLRQVLQELPRRRSRLLQRVRRGLRDEQGQFLHQRGHGG